jgi:hypothetical protein
MEGLGDAERGSVAQHGSDLHPIEAAVDEGHHGQHVRGLAGERRIA